MSGIMRLVVLVTAVVSSLGALTVSPAGAVTWDTNGTATFAATGGASTFGIDQDPPTAGGTLMTCNVTTASITVTPTGVGAIFTALRGTSAATCITLGNSYVLDCTFALTAQAWAAGPPAVTSGTLDQACNLNSGGTHGCTFPATSNAEYVNPSGPTTGRLTLTTFSGAVPPCLTGAVGTFTMTEQSWRVTGGGGPVITRTA